VQSVTLAAPVVAHVIYRLDHGGLENGVINLVNSLPAERFQQAIVCLAGFNPEFRRRIRREGVLVIPLEKQPGKDVGIYARMWRTLRQLRPDVVHTRNLGTLDMQWVAAAAGVPVRVHGEHGWDASDPDGLSSKRLRIRRACRPAVQHYVPMSQDIARWLERDVGVDAGRIRQLYNGVDVRRFSPGVASPVPVRAGNRDGPMIGTVGRLDPVKDQASLIRAFATLRQRYTGAKLLVVGDGPLRTALEAQAVLAGVAEAVSFLGVRDDIPDLLRSMDVFALPSVNEGISNTILEAMASGLPVVARRVGGNPELVDDGITGTLYEGASADALARALAPYLADPTLRAAQGTAARERAVQKFSLEGMVQRYAALYDELLSAHSRPRRDIFNLRAQ
jgi:sugar transferase (PEP-CTERM/EpsH1 system associated)